MKKLLSVVLVLALALTGFALAEAVSSDRTQLSTEAQIAAMTPILDAVAKNAAEYDVENPEMVWKIAGKVAENVKGANPTATEEEMFAYAEACFAGLDAMPEVAGSTVSNTADMKGYAVKSSEDALTTIVVHYSIDAEGKLYAVVNVYDEKNEIVDTAVVRLVANEAADAAYPMSVEAVNPSVDGVEFTEEVNCHIPFIKPVAAEPTATPEPKELKRGVTGEKVKAMQKRLRKLGYLAMYADGDFGPRTEEAVELFQKTAGFEVDGIAGYRTLKALNDKDAPKCTDYISLEKGDSGKRVVELQNALIKRGLLSESKATEKYDGDTVDAVKAFLSQNGLTGDGKKIAADVVKSIVEIPAPTEAPTEEPTPEPTEAPIPAPELTAAPATEAPTQTESPSEGSETGEGEQP